MGGGHHLTAPTMRWAPSSPPAGSGGIIPPTRKLKLPALEWGAHRCQGGGGWGSGLSGTSNRPSNSVLGQGRGHGEATISVFAQADVLDRGRCLFLPKAVWVFIALPAGHAESSPSKAAAGSGHHLTPSPLMLGMAGPRDSHAPDVALGQMFPTPAVQTMPTVLQQKHELAKGCGPDTGFPSAAAGGGGWGGWWVWDHMDGLVTSLHEDERNGRNARTATSPR